MLKEFYPRCQIIKIQNTYSFNLIEDISFYFSLDESVYHVLLLDFVTN